jgi:hypothetical protein
MAAFSPFSGKAIKPEYQPIVEALIAYCLREQLSANEFNIRVFGEGKPGVAKSQRGYDLMHGKIQPTFEIAELIREKTGVDLSPYAKQSIYGRRAVTVSRRRKPVKPSARQALVEFKEALDKDDGWKKLDPPRTKLGPPKFALVVQQDGTASMTMNLIDVDTDEAMRAFEAMKAIGLVKG